MRLRTGLIVVALLFTATTHAQIYRWDNGQVIPGTEGITPGPGVQLNSEEIGDRNLRFADFGGDLDLTGASFFQSWLDDSDFSGANLTSATFGSATLTNANLTRAVIFGADFSRTNLTMEQLYSTASYQDSNLGAIALATNDVSGWNFSGQNLEGAHFGKIRILPASNLVEALFNDAFIRRANFSGATYTGFTEDDLYGTASYQMRNLEGIGLEFNDLNDWNLSEQNLTNASFYDSYVTNLILTGAVVTGANFGHTTSKGFTPDQLYSTASYRAMELPGVFLYDNDLTGWDFRGQNLTSARLFGSTLTQVDFSGANLTDAFLHSSTLANANLTGADTRGAGGMDLTGATSRNAILPSGTVAGLNLVAGDQLVVRNYAMPITVQDRLTTENGGVMQILFNDSPWDSLISFQPGIPIQLGGTLELIFTDDTLLASQSGRTIKAFDWTGVTPQGTFSVQVQPGTAWDTSKLYTTGEVTLLGISSDLNSDRDVDSEDLLDFLANWTGADYPAADKTWQNGDSDEDGDVDSADLLVFLSQWTGAASVPSVVASVPEPTGAFLIGVGVAGLIVNMRRRNTES